MTYSYNDIKSIELEISTFCNAACPQCPRNILGGKTIDNLPLINWTMQQFRSILKVEFIQQLEMVYFCGTYGDPMTNPDIVNMCKWLKTINPNLKIGIHTNGGVGKTITYTQLASIVNFIAFGIDGLEDTNHLYRRNTSWNSIIKNVKSFIESGGYAIWDFIVFRHNQHQVDIAKKLSQQLKFKEFNVKKTGRFFNKEHQLVDSVDVINTQGVKEYTLQLPDKVEFVNREYQRIKEINLNEYIENTKINCYWLKHNMLYIGADGNVFPCGLLHDRLYGVESERSVDHKKILHMMNDIGDKQLANIFHTDLEEIVNGAWFKKIQSSWTSDRLQRCGVFCGEKINLLADQSSSIKYKK